MFKVKLGDMRTHTFDSSWTTSPRPCRPALLAYSKSCLRSAAYPAVPSLKESLAQHVSGEDGMDFDLRPRRCLDELTSCLHSSAFGALLKACPGT